MLRDFPADGVALAGILGFVGDGDQFRLDPHVGIAPQLDVGAAARHVGGDGHRAGLARLGHDEGFLFVIAGIQHVVLDFALLEEFGELF